MDRSELYSFGENILKLARHAALWPGESFHIDLILNYKAGGFTSRRRFAEHVRAVEQFVGELSESGRAPRETSAGIYFTEYRGHARDIAQEIVLGTNGDERRRLVISAGGDGTHGDLMSVFLHADPAIRERLCVFRMPFGTGNDGADAKTVYQACTLLATATTFSRANAVRVTAAGREPLYAFNIASIGIDAYVTDTTNKLKGLVPGDIYKVIADAATLFYEPVYKVRPMKLEFTDPSGARTELEGRFILLAVGTSGHREYGNGKRILPTEDNLCAIRRVGLIRKLEMKKRVYNGTHIGQDITESAGAQRVEIRYEGRVPMQLDGEAVWLDADDFPLVMEVTTETLAVLGGAAREDGKRGHDGVRS